MIFNIFKIEYNWYEGEHEETLLGKNIDKKKFEKDLTEAKNFAISLIGNEIKGENYLGKGYSIECLPEFYEQIIWFLINKKGYIECYFDENTKYNINDPGNKQINITKLGEITNRIELD